MRKKSSHTPERRLWDSADNVIAKAPVSWVHRGTGALAATRHRAGPRHPLGALESAGAPWGKGLLAVGDTPVPTPPGEGGTRPPAPVPSRRAGETGEDVPFWRMPPLIHNNAPDGPARTSLVRDVARSELVPREGGTERGQGPAHRWHRRRDLQPAKGRFLVFI